MILEHEFTPIAPLSLGRTAVEYGKRNCQDFKHLNSAEIKVFLGFSRVAAETPTSLFPSGIAEEIDDSCRFRLLVKALLCREFKKGLRHGDYPKLPVLRETESNSGQTPR
ncbi:MAG: hypothetical protein WB341_14750 [Terracidiphilus sp.]